MGGSRTDCASIEVCDGERGGGEGIAGDVSMSEAATATGVPADPFSREAAIEAKRTWRAHNAQRGEATPAIRIALAATFTVDTLVPFIGAALLAEGTVPEFRIAPYNQLFQTCLDPQASFDGPSDVIVLLWRLEVLMLDEINGFLGGDAEALKRAGDKLDALAGAVSRLRAGFKGMVVVGVPPYPTGPAANVLALDNAGGLGGFHRALAGRFVDEIGGIENVYLVDL